MPIKFIKKIIILISHQQTNLYYKLIHLLYLNKTAMFSVHCIEK